MKKFSVKTEEIMLMIVALIILLSSFWNAYISLLIAIITSITAFIYNLITKEKDDFSNGEQE